MTIYQLAWRNLWRNRRRTLITAASVFFAVILATFMASLQTGVWQNMIRNVVSMHTGTIQIQNPKFDSEPNINNSLALDPKIEELIEAEKGVISASPRLDGLVLASSGARSRVALVMGIRPEDHPALEDRMQEGEYLKSTDSHCIIGTKLAEYMQLDIGDTLIILGQGYHGATAAGQAIIKGLISLGSPDLNDRAVYIELKKAQDLFGAEDRVSSYVVNLTSTTNLEKTESKLQTKLGDEFNVQTWKEILPELEQSIRADMGSGLLVRLVLYLIIAFGMLGTILMMTLERQYEFGVLVAVGMKRIKLSLIIVFEGVMIALLGASAGLLAALVILNYLHHNPVPLGNELSAAYEQYGIEAVWYFSVNPSIFSEQTILVAVIAAVVSIYPVYKISKLKPVEAMRG